MNWIIDLGNNVVAELVAGIIICGLLSSWAKRLTGEAVNLLLLPEGLSGWVMTSLTSWPSSKIFLREQTAESGLPKNTIFIREYLCPAVFAAFCG